MKRVMITRIAVGLMAALISIGASSGASAAILSWGCQGQLGDQRVLFDRDGLYVVDGKAPAGKPKKFTADTVSTAIAELKKSKDTFTDFGPYGDDSLEGPIVFSTIDANRQTQKIVFTQKLSHLISHKHRMICGRDEDSDLYRMVYRFDRPGQPAQDIKMQCAYYQLSTRGGRKGCGED
jgi:hypothetical protein